MGPPSYMRSVADRNVVMRRIPAIQTCSEMWRRAVYVTSQTTASEP